MKNWIERINGTEALWDMENLMDEIALDDNLSNEEYETLYEMALERMR